MRGRAPWSGAWLCALAAAIVAAGALLSPHLAPAFGVPVHPIPHDQPLVLRFFVWDAKWYDKIARHGYAWHGPGQGAQNVAFFPLWPLVLRAVYVAAGEGAAGRWGVVALAAALGFGSILAVLRTATALAGPERGRIAALLYVCSPALPQLFLAYPTGLLGVLAALALFDWHAGRRWRAAGWCGVASGAGPLAVCLAGPLALSAGLAARMRGGSWMSVILVAAGTGLVAVAGLLLYVAYLAAVHHDPLAFHSAQDAWVRPATLAARLRYLARSLLVWPDLATSAKAWWRAWGSMRAGQGRLAEESVELAIGHAALGLMVTGAAASLRLRPRLAGGFALAVIGVYVWMIAASIGAVSAARLTYLALPSFMGLAILAAGRPVLWATLAVLGVACGVVRAALLFGGYWAI